MKNNAPTGKTDPLPAYIHGITRQLPHYIEGAKAKYGYYITGQHYDGTIDRSKDHGSRVQDVESARNTAEGTLKTNNSGFISLIYKNINMSQRPSASRR